MNKNLQTTPRTKKAKLAWWNDLDKKWKELFINCLEDNIDRELHDLLYDSSSIGDELKEKERILTKRWNGFFKKENNSKELCFSDKFYDIRDNPINYINYLVKINIITEIPEYYPYDIPDSKLKEKDISPLSFLIHLKYLNFSGNRVRDLSPLKNLKKLKNLNFYRNWVKDVSPLANLKQLTYIDGSCNHINDLSPLSVLSKLEYLNCNANRIEKLFDKNHCLVNLKELDLHNNNITDISSLSTMKKLIKLNLDNNPENYFYPKKRGIKGITSIKSLQELKNLTFLSLRGHLIYDISPLDKLTKLEYLILSKNKIHDISYLAKLKNLTNLDISGNLISKNDIKWLKKRLPKCKIISDH